MWASRLVHVHVLFLFFYSGCDLNPSKRAPRPREPSKTVLECRRIKCIQLPRCQYNLQWLSPRITCSWCRAEQPLALSASVCHLICFPIGSDVSSPSHPHAPLMLVIHHIPWWLGGGEVHIHTVWRISSLRGQTPHHPDSLVAL